MAAPPRSLRRTLAVALGLIAVLSGVASISLVVITGLLHRTSATIGAAVERQQIAEDGQRDLLLRDRANAPAVRERLARDVLDRLERIARSAVDDEERLAAVRALALARDHIHATGAGSSPRDDRAVQEALATLERLERGRLATVRTEAERLHDVAKVVGGLTAAFVLTGTVLVLLSLTRHGVRPLLRVAAQVRAFGRGDDQVRADEVGPAEVSEIARSFNAMADRLAEQRHAHRTFLAGVAHDLRNPIQALRVAVELDHDALGQCSPQVKTVLGVVQRQLGRLERLVADLLDTANLQAGRLALQRSEHDLRDIARSVAALFEGASASHEIKVVVPDAPVLAECDAQRIEQVLTNFVSNAIKYSPGGGQVSIEVTRHDGAAVIRVCDEGVGMTGEQVESAFRPFARTGALRESVPGYGLGLFVAERIVEEHGGVIHVESAPGRGSAFRIDLPEASGCAG